MIQGYNDIFYTAALLEELARKTSNTRADIATTIGADGIRDIYSVAEVSHCLPMKQVVEELTEKYHIKRGTYHPEAKVENPPKATAIGKNYARMVTHLESCEENYPNRLFEILTSRISELMTDYQSAFYYSPTDYLVQTYQNLSG